MTIFSDLSLPNPPNSRRSKALGDIIREEITKKENVISFAEFMSLALYHPKLGYYNSKSFDIGNLGDFTTAAEISPLYAQCFANQISPIFDFLGEKNILEIGAGTGRFAHDILTTLAKTDHLPHYYIYEISTALRAKQQTFLKTHCPQFLSHIHWLTHLPSDFKGIVIANEVLDALPVHCFKVEAGIVKEKYVSIKDDAFIWHTSTPSPQLSAAATQLLAEYELNEGYESEVNLALVPFIHSLTEALSQGVLFFADYGYGGKEYYHPQRNKGTLTCFYQHRHHNDPLILPGLQDITAHVNFTQVIEEATKNGCTLAGFTTQAAFLLANRLLELANDVEKELSQVAAFKLHQAIKLLTLPTEMGERVKIMAISKGVNISMLGFKLQDRRREL